MSGVRKKGVAPRRRSVPTSTVRRRRVERVEFRCKSCGEEMWVRNGSSLLTTGRCWECEHRRDGAAARIASAIALDVIQNPDIEPMRKPASIAAMAYQIADAMEETRTLTVSQADIDAHAAKEGE